MPFSVVLFRFLWPFWLFRDASRGDRLARAAAYRHNRDMRVYLPGYLMKWLLSSAFVLIATTGLDSLAQSFAPISTALTLASAACAIVFACSICVLFITAYIYLYLSRHDH
jgi:cytochrome b subunit of formate dehydrogenase